MKTVRFAELVATAGAPEAHQLWLPPAQDPAFQRALKAHRVLTIHQQNVGAKKDYGVVGFHEEPLAQFVVFPKSVREFEGRRVIGINYDLLSRAANNGAKPVARAAGRSRKAARASSPFAPAPARADAQTASAGPRPASKRAARKPRAAQQVSAIVNFDPKPSPRARPEVTSDPETAPAGASTPSRSRRRPARAAGKPDRPLLDPHVGRELTRALKDLKAGKTVAAYERLQRLLGNAVA